LTTEFDKLFARDQDAFIREELVYVGSPLPVIIVNLLSKYGPLTRNELVRLTHEPRTTIYDAMTPMITRGVITSFPLHIAHKRGHPKVFFKLNRLEEWKRKE
jgi:hypothetical protein